MCPHLGEELLKRRYKVIIFDDLSTRRQGNISPLIEPSCHSEQSEESYLRSG